MKAFLEWLEADPSFASLRAELNQALGARLLRAVCEARWLVQRRGRATRYPCARPERLCHRWVIAQPDDPNEPFSVRCGHCPQMCPPEVLGQHDVVLWTPAPHHLASWLARQLALDGPIEALRTQTPGFHLGTRMSAQQRERFFLVLQPSSEELPWLLGRIADLDAPSWVLVPTWEGVRIPERVRYWRHACVTLVALEDALSFDAEHARVTLAPLDKARERPLLWSGQGTRPCASVLDADGLRLLDRVEYDQLMERRGQLDLFIDMSSPTSRGRYAAWTRKKKRVEAAELTLGEAAVLVWLIQKAPLAVSVARLRQTQALQRPDKIVERARALVDVHVGRYAWRSFHTLPGPTRDAKCYQFEPPPGLRWAVIQPFKQEDASAAQRPLVRP